MAEKTSRPRIALVTKGVVYGTGPAPTVPPAPKKSAVRRAKTTRARKAS